MDELIFAGNKYISSKRAAKFTGYAPDYIGQMCRGGNMDCRLVGRNWYIKETDVIEQRKSFKKEQGVQIHNRIAYKKYELEDPVYYIDDNRPNNLEINKKDNKHLILIQKEKEIKIYGYCIVCKKTILKRNIKKYCSLFCTYEGQKKIKLFDEEFVKLLEENNYNYSAVGRIFNVSSNAIKKHYKKILLK